MSTLLSQAKLTKLLCDKVKDFESKGHSRNTAYGVFMNLEHADGELLINKYDSWESTLAECLDVAYGPRVSLEDGF